MVFGGKSREPTSCHFDLSAVGHLYVHDGVPDARGAIAPRAEVTTLARRSIEETNMMMRAKKGGKHTNKSAKELQYSSI
jgi:hypothetical protein